MALVREYSGFCILCDVEVAVTDKPTSYSTHLHRDEVMAARANKESSQPSVSKVLSQRAQHHGVVTGVAGLTVWLLGWLSDGWRPT